MINVGTYTTALYNKLVAAGLTATIERGERINFDPGRCPWMGVYPGSVSSAPRTLGGGSSRWSSSMELQVVVQTCSFDNDGRSASDALETLIESMLQAIDNDLTLGVVGCRILSNSREYRYVMFDDDGQGTIFMPQAVVKLNIDARST